MNIQYRVELSEAERAELTAMLSDGKHAVRKIKIKIKLARAYPDVLKESKSL